MAKTLHHKMSPGWICLDSRFFSLKVSGGPKQSQEAACHASAELPGPCARGNWHWDLETSFVLCHTHPLFENKVMGDSFDLHVFVHCSTTTSVLFFTWLTCEIPCVSFCCEGVNGLQARAKYVLVKFSGLCLIKLHVGALDWHLLPSEAD